MSPRPIFEAPELHSDGEYDAFLTDAFSLGMGAKTMKQRSTQAANKGKQRQW